MTCFAVYSRTRKSVLRKHFLGIFFVSQYRLHFRSCRILPCYAL